MSQLWFLCSHWARILNLIQFLHFGQFFYIRGKIPLSLKISVPLRDNQGSVWDLKVLHFNIYEGGNFSRGFPEQLGIRCCLWSSARDNSGKEHISDAMTQVNIYSLTWKTI